MPQVRRISQTRLAASLRERETLTTCPSCSGKGFHVFELGTRYKRTECRWCAGACVVPAVVVGLYRRAARISGFMRAAS